MSQKNTVFSKLMETKGLWLEWCSNGVTIKVVSHSH